MATRTIRAPRLATVRRRTERVSPLELFFDLVFVLAITQCTALIADEPTWAGVAKGLAVLALLWWAWGGFAWLTTVVDPDEGIVRVAMFGAMAGLLVVALSVPGAFEETALTFAAAYGLVRIAHLVVFALGGRGDPDLLKSVAWLAVTSVPGIGLLLAASAADGGVQAALWGIALTVDVGGPFFFGVEGWRLAPRHFAERHGLIMIIALGESIVAIGVGITGDVDAGIVAVSALGIAVAAALWWLYFDVVALVAERRLAAAAPGREQNSMARDSYSYLHFPMVAGIVLVALGVKKTIGHVGDPLKLVPAAALFGGTALYLLAHVAFRLRNVHTVNRQRLAAAVLLLALVPLAHEVPALAALAILAGILSSLIAYESLRFAEARDRIRHRIEHQEAAEAELPAADSTT